jgi:hypothetical protein
MRFKVLAHGAWSIGYIEAFTKHTEDLTTILSNTRASYGAFQPDLQIKGVPPLTYFRAENAIPDAPYSEFLASVAKHELAPVR